MENAQGQVSGTSKFRPGAVPKSAYESVHLAQAPARGDGGSVEGGRGKDGHQNGQGPGRRPQGTGQEGKGRREGMAGGCEQEEGEKGRP